MIEQGSDRLSFILFAYNRQIQYFCNIGVVGRDAQVPEQFFYIRQELLFSVRQFAYMVEGKSILFFCANQFPWLIYSATHQ